MAGGEGGQVIPQCEIQQQLLATNNNVNNYNNDNNKELY